MLKKILKNPWVFAIIITTVYFAINLILTLNHEPYLDEAHSWLYAKNLSIPQLFSVLKADGHPPLFYIILMPFAKIGLPYITLNIITLVITTLAILLLVRYAPFPRWLRILVAFSPAFTYFLPAFGRDYCLAALGFVLVCVTYKNRSTRPIPYAASIALLFQTHVITAAPAGLLTLLFIFEQAKSKRITPKFIASICIIILSFVALALPLLGSLGTHGLVGNPSWEGDNIAQIFQLLFGNNLIVTILLLVFAIFLILFLSQYSKQAIVLGVSTATFLIISEYIYALTKSQQVAILLLLFLWAYWTIHYETISSNRVTRLFYKLEIIKLIFCTIVHQTKQKSVKLAVIMSLPFILSTPNLVYWAQKDLFYRFSLSKDAAQYINQNLPPGSTIITGNERVPALSVIPYLQGNRIIWDVLTEQEKKYMTFGHDTYRVLSYNHISQTIYNYFGGQDDVYYIVLALSVDTDGNPILNERPSVQSKNYFNQLELLWELSDSHTGGSGIYGESYIAIYKIPPNFQPTNTTQTPQKEVP